MIAPYFVTFLDDENIEEACAEEDLTLAELVARDGVSLPGWYWALTRPPHSLGSQRAGRMHGPYGTQEEAFSDARRSIH